MEFSEKAQIIIDFTQKALTGDSDALFQLESIVKMSDSYQNFLEILFSEAEGLEKIKFSMCNSLINHCKIYTSIIPIVRDAISNYIAENVETLAIAPDQMKRALSKLVCFLYEGKSAELSDLVIKIFDFSEKTFRFGVFIADDYINLTKSIEGMSYCIQRCFRPLTNPNSDEFNLASAVNLLLSASSIVLKWSNDGGIPSETEEAETVKFIRNIIFSTPFSIFEAAKRLPYVKCAELLRVLQNSLQIPKYLYEAEYESTIKQTLSEITKNILMDGVASVQYEPFAMLSLKMASLDVVKKCDDADLIMPWFNSLEKMIIKSATKENISRYFLTVEYASKTITKFQYFDLFNTNAEVQTAVHESVDKMKGLIFDTLTDDECDQFLKSRIENICVEDPSRVLFTSIGSMLAINKETVIPDMVEILGKLAESKNNGLGPMIEIATQLIIPSCNSSLIETIEKTMPIIEMTHSICLGLDPYPKIYSKQSDNSPRNWLEVSFVHFFNTLTKTYISNNNKVGETVFSEKPEIITTFFARIMFNLSQEDYEISEVILMTESIKVEQYPEAIISSILANETAMGIVTQCNFPFTRDDSLNEQSRSLYSSLFALSNRCEDPSLLDAILKSNIERFEDPMLIDTTLESILGFFETKFNLTTIYKFLIDNLFPVISTISLDVQHKNTIAKFMLKYSTMIYTAKKSFIPPMSQVALAHFSSFIGVVLTCIKGIGDIEDEEVRANIIGLIVSAVRVFLKWKCINIGVLVEYGNTDAVNLIKELFTAISQCNFFVLVHEDNFKASFVELVMEIAEIFVDIGIPNEEVLDIKNMSVHLLIYYIKMSMNIDDIDRLFSCLSNCILSSDVIESDENIIHCLTVAVAIFALDNNDKKLPNVLKILVQNLLRVDSGLWTQFALEALSEVEEYRKQAAIDTFLLNLEENMNDELWKSLLEAFGCIEDQMKDLDIIPFGPKEE